MRSLLGIVGLVLLLAWPAAGQTTKRYGVDNYSKLGFRQNGITKRPAASGGSSVVVPVVTVLASVAQPTNTATVITASISPADSALLLAFCYNLAANPALSVAGNGLTWIKFAERAAVFPSGAP